MPEEIINIPVTVQGREFYDGDSTNGLWQALKACKDAKCRALFMPEFADVRINSPKGSRIWQNWYSAPSARVTGKTKQGSPVVVYAHVPNYFSNPENIRKAIYSKNLVNGAGIMPDKEFQKLLNLEDGLNVSVVEHDKLKNSVSGVISVDDALEHPQTIPFLGGQKRAEAYLRKHREVFGNKIGIGHTDDLSDKGSLGRLLFAGDGNCDDLGGGSLDYGGRFVGVPSCAEGAPRKIASPLEKLAGAGTDVGNGLVVVRADQIPPDVYSILTGKR